MRIRPLYLAAALFILITVVAVIAHMHMDNLLAFIVIGPGYLVQAWLFETHRALGGFGYQATIVGVSAVVWTVIILSLSAAVGLGLRRVRRQLNGPSDR